MPHIISNSIRGVRLANGRELLTRTDWDFQVAEAGLIAVHKANGSKIFYPWSSIESVELTTAPGDAVLA